MLNWLRNLFKRKPPMSVWAKAQQLKLNTPPEPKFHADALKRPPIPAARPARFTPMTSSGTVVLTRKYVRVPFGHEVVPTSLMDCSIAPMTLPLPPDEPVSLSGGGGDFGGGGATSSWDSSPSSSDSSSSSSND